LTGSLVQLRLATAAQDFLTAEPNCWRSVGSKATMSEPLTSRAITELSARASSRDSDSMEPAYDFQGEWLGITGVVWLNRDETLLAWILLSPRSVPRPILTLLSMLGTTSHRRGRAMVGPPSTRSFRHATGARLYIVAFVLASASDGCTTSTAKARASGETAPGGGSASTKASRRRKSAPTSERKVIPCPGSWGSCVSGLKIGEYCSLCQTRG